MGVDIEYLVTSMELLYMFMISTRLQRDILELKEAFSGRNLYSLRCLSYSTSVLNSALRGGCRWCTFWRGLRRALQGGVRA